MNKPKGLHKIEENCRKKLCGEENRRLLLQEEEEEEPQRRMAVRTTGTLKNLVILIQFKDHAESKNRQKDIPTKEEIEFLMNSDESSLRSIYDELSSGQLDVESYVTDWFVTSETEAWYADGDSGTTNLHEGLREALTYFDGIIDFSYFDDDKDGKIDCITFLTSGYGAEHLQKDQYGAHYLDR